MSNLNFILKSNKCEFTNFFREPIIIPANSEVALVKGNLTIPVFVQQFITIPELTAGAERNTRFIYAQVDGVPLNFIWTDLYTAFATFTDGLDQNGALVTANNFFSGDYKFFINNPVWGEDTAGANVQEKISFNEVFAKMLDTSYKFYNITARPDWTRNDPDILSGVVDFSAGAANKIITFPNNTKQWGINAEYNPAWATEAVDGAPLTLDAADNAVWNTAVGAQWTSVGGGVAGTYDNVYINTENPIDPNGGWLGFQYNSVKNTTFVGISLETGNINAGGAGLQNVVLPTNAEPSIVDIGFKFAQDAAGNNVYQIVDGHTNFSLISVAPNLIPIQAYHSFDNDVDYFYIQISRVGLIAQNQYKYVVSLFRNDGGPTTTTPGDQGILLYQTTRILASPAISATPIFLSDGQANVIRDVSHIPALPQSYFQSEIDSQGQSGQGNIIIEQGTGNLTELAPLRQDIIDFYSILSLETFQSAGSLEGIITNDPTQSALLLKWDRNLQILGKDCNKYIGISNPNKIYSYQIGKVGPPLEPYLGLQLNPLYNNTDLPRMLDVSILDSTLKNVSGACPATAINGIAQNTFDTSTIDRIVGTIPTDLEADNNVNFDWILQTAKQSRSS